jgi:hypothetical protein
MIVFDVKNVSKQLVYSAWKINPNIVLVGSSARHVRLEFINQPLTWISLLRMLFPSSHEFTYFRLDNEIALDFEKMNSLRAKVAAIMTV